jgi:CheY-like chemotaxis protein
MQKIMIADDDARMRQVLGQVVTGRASTLVEASDGGEATALSATERPVWVLIDSIDPKQQANPLKAPIRHPQTRNTTIERETSYAEEH